MSKAEMLEKVKELRLLIAIRNPSAELPTGGMSEKSETEQIDTRVAAIRAGNELYLPQLAKFVNPDEITLRMVEFA